MQVIDVGAADFAIADATHILVSKGIGSCVVICLYDEDKKIGALSHIMLPKRPDTVDLNPKRFADTALAQIFEELERLGSPPDHLVAQLVGGASMFQHVDPFINNIGALNVASVRQILAARGIRIRGTDIGGSLGRNVSFSLDSGKVTVTSKLSHEKE